jgi:hypothetical protein
VVVQTLAKINVLKPNGEESFIETAYVFPCLSSEGQTSPRGLLNVLGKPVIEIQAAEGAIHGIVGPEPVEQQDLCQSASQSGQASDGETNLGETILSAEHAGDRTYVSSIEALSQSVKSARMSDYIWIQNQNQFGIRCPNALVYGTSEAPVF